MKTAVINIVGTIQEVGYRTKVIAYAHVLNIKGYIRNLPDTTVEIVAQGSEESLKTFIEKIEIKDEFIKVEYVKVKYTDEFEGFKEFHKIVGSNETDSRLDKAVNELKNVVTAIKETNQSIQNMNENLGNKMDNLNNKMDQMNEKMDQNHTELITEIREGNQGIVNKMDQNHTELITEVRSIREDNSDRVMNEVREVASDVQEVKALLKMHLKQS